MHIGIAGNIGSTYNPYLEDYYKDIPRWSYNLETYFLAQRFKDVLEIAGSNDTVIQDRTIFEGVYIFVANNKALGNLSERDYNTFMELFNLMMSMVKLPDLLIYLKSSDVRSSRSATWPSPAPDIRTGTSR